MVINRGWKKRKCYLFWLSFTSDNAFNVIIKACGQKTYFNWTIAFDGNFIRDKILLKETFKWVLLDFLVSDISHIFLKLL